jgi:tRNA_anti-like
MTTKKKVAIKWILVTLLAIITTGAVVGYKMYNKPHRSVEEAKAITVAAIQLATQYETNEPEANSDYLDKVLEVSGEINEITKNQKGEPVITLKGTDMSGVTGTIENAKPDEIKPGATVILKGICTGYLTDVVLVRCVLKNK